MAWVWRYRNGNGDPVVNPEGARTSDEFSSQSDAESWLGEEWRDLFAGGIAAVALEEDGRQEYIMELVAE
jgi:hypothetical protein